MESGVLILLGAIVIIAGMLVVICAQRLPVHRTHLHRERIRAREGALTKEAAIHIL